MRSKIGLTLLAGLLALSSSVSRADDQSSAARAVEVGAGAVGVAAGGAQMTHSLRGLRILGQRERALDNAINEHGSDEDLLLHLQHQNSDYGGLVKKRHELLGQIGAEKNAVKLGQLKTDLKNVETEIVWTRRRYDDVVRYARTGKGAEMLTPREIQRVEAYKGLKKSMVSEQESLLKKSSLLGKNGVFALYGAFAPGLVAIADFWSARSITNKVEKAQAHSEVPVHEATESHEVSVRAAQ
jgi:hypothetical protein